ncbi:TonB-dependent receptor [Novosphingobium sp. Rr 2-17]|uniref:TonB-dependent receptor n=1 Tax=Novosphingobium sp. Rr 2-17 TaxID=555793 RepID=UPI001ED94745|nr:TonB-dependent receptor [Novosphingobium sp. Rr 2-17]
MTSVSAQAQNQTAGDPAGDTRQAGYISADTLQEIIVTAERRQSTSQKTATAITVRAGQDLVSQGRYQLKNILEDVPGVLGGVTEFGNTSGTDNPSSGLTIRGIQSTQGDGVTSAASAAAIYVDEVYAGLGSNYDIDRVEVLRGPQGTLYGRSATSGVLAIHTRDPQLEYLGADFTGEVGNYDTKHLAGAVNVPIVTDKIAVRASGNFYQRDSYDADNGGGYRRNLDGRVKVLLQPTDGFSAMVGFAIEDNKSRSNGVAINQVSPDKFVFSDAPVGPGKNRSWQVWGVFKLDLGATTLTYIPAYRDFNNESVGYARGALAFNQTVKTPKDYFNTQEIRLSSDDASALKWQVGALYYYNALSNSNTTEDVNPVTGIPYRVSQRTLTSKNTTEIGLFAQSTWEFAAGTRLTGGLRYDYTKIVASQDYTTQDPFTGAYSSLSLEPQDGTRKYHNVTFKARLEHDLSSRNLVYASISSGFSPGDVSITTDANYQPTVLDLKAQTLTAYEIGSKNRFAGDKLQVNAAAYYYNYGGYQVTNINIAPAGAPSAFTVMNIPVHARGVELEVLAKPWARGQFSLGAEYSVANYHDVPTTAAPYFPFKRVPGVPPFRVNTSYSHTIALQDGASLMLSGFLHVNSSYNVSTIDQTFVDTGYEGYTHLGWRATGDLNASLNIDGGRFSLTGYIRNVADTRYKLSTVVSSFIVTASTVTLSDPRTYGLVLTARF